MSGENRAVNLRLQISDGGVWIVGGELRGDGAVYVQKDVVSGAGWGSGGDPTIKDDAGRILTRDRRFKDAWEYRFQYLDAKRENNLVFG